jgi:hypothetical protein
MSILDEWYTDFLLCQIPALYSTLVKFFLKLLGTTTYYISSRQKCIINLSTLIMFLHRIPACTINSQFSGVLFSNILDLMVHDVHLSMAK